MMKPTLFSVLCIFASLVPAVHAEMAYEVEWVREIDDVWCNSVAVDASGNAYTGSNRNPYLLKYDGSGDLLWSWPIGIGDNNAVTVDSFGNVYATGDSYPHPGGYASLYKVDNSGSVLWSQHFWAEGRENQVNLSQSVAADASGNVFITGTHEFITWPHGEFIEPYFVMSTAIFLAKYDSSGGLLWSQQQDETDITDLHYSTGVAVDTSGNAFITGYTGGHLGGPNAGSVADALLSKYDTSGNLLWTKQLGTDGRDESSSVAVDGSGNAYITGYTEGDLGGPNAGSADAFLAKYDTSGNLLWTKQLGTDGRDYSSSVAVDGSGSVFISENTRPNSSIDDDTFLVKFSPVPEPSALVLLLLGLLALIGARRR